MKKYTILFLICFALSISSACKQSSSAKSYRQQKTSQGFEVDFTTLSWPRKEIEDAGTVQEAQLTSPNFYIIFDGSGSMEGSRCAGGGKKIDVAKKALKEFSTAIPENAHLGLYAFDGKGRSERVSLTNNDKQDFSLEVDRIKPGGGTPLRSAITDSLLQLEKQAAAQLGYGEYHLVIITDGMASNGQDPYGIVKEILTRTPIVIHTIGFCIRQHHPLNLPGRTLYKSADNPSEFTTGLQSVLAEAESFQVDSFKGL